MKNNITYILPIHEYNENVKGYLDKLLPTVKESSQNVKDKLFIVGPKQTTTNVKGLAEGYGIQNVTLIDNDETNLFTQINKGVMKCTSKYFCILEYDDVLRPFWPVAAEPYMKENSEASIFMPIVRLYDEKNKVTSFSNEVAWAISFTENMGQIDLKMMENYMDYTLSGALIKTEAFISAGMLKPSLSIAAVYEFLMRMAYKGNKIFVVPKCGYVHTINREGSFYKTETSKITQDEAMFYIKTAKQEYFFDNDRNIKYEKKDDKNKE